MNGNRNIIDIIETVVSQMTPFVYVSSIEASGDNWKLNTCNTYWITIDSEITIDEVSYTVLDLVQDSHIIISADTEPTVTEFQLEAPEFWHSASRKVSNERSQKQDVRKPFVYLPIPRVTEDNTIGSDLAYNADIRPIFLTNYNPQKDTIELQQTQIIEPLNAMADFFIYLIRQDTTNFDDFDSVQRREWMNFGEETVWGSDKKIFKENLSGVELSSFTLPVLINENCSCNAITKVCADATVTVNDEFYAFVESGGSINIETGVCDDATITVNSNAFATVPSSESLNIGVQYQTSEENPIHSIVEGNIIITDPIVIPTTRIYTKAIDSGSLVSYADGDTYYRKINEIGKLVQPEVGVVMRLQFGSFSMLEYPNIHGNLYRITGLSGGYRNPIDGLYYNKLNVLSTYSEAFPFDIGIDHISSDLIDMRATANNIWSGHCASGLVRTTAGFTGWYPLSVPEGAQYGNWSSLSAYNNGNPPFDWGTGLKVLGDTYAGGTTQCMVLQTFGHITSTSKANNNKCVFLKPININTDIPIT